jgi:hypothetical protein
MDYVQTTTVLRVLEGRLLGPLGCLDLVVGSVPFVRPPQLFVSRQHLHHVLIIVLEKCMDQDMFHYVVRMPESMRCHGPENAKREPYNEAPICSCKSSHAEL